MKSLPNILTLFRLISPILIFVSVFFVARPYGPWAGFVIFVLAAASDFLDGYLARRFEGESNFGRVFDPISDKILILSVGFILVVGHVTAVGFVDMLIVIPFLLIVMRELLISGMREGLAGSLNVPVSWTAKTKTTVQMVAVGLLFLLPILGHRLSEITQGMDDVVIQGILARSIEDEVGLLFTIGVLNFVEIAVYIVFWLAAILTLVSGYQYFRFAQRQNFGAAE